MALGTWDELEPLGLPELSPHTESEEQAGGMQRADTPTIEELLSSIAELQRLLPSGGSGSVCEGGSPHAGSFPGCSLNITNSPALPPCRSTASPALPR